MDRKSLLAIVVCVLFYAAYEYYLNKKYPDRFRRSVSEVAGSSVPSPGLQGKEAAHGSSALSVAQVPAEDAEILSPDELLLENDEVRYRFDQSTGAVKSLVLKQYQNDAGTGEMEILKAPLKILGTTGDELPVLPPLLKGNRDGDRLSFSFRKDSWLITQSYLLTQGSGYGADISVSWKNLASVPQELHSSVVMSGTILFPEKSGSFLPGMPTGRPSFLTSIAGKTDWVDAQKYCEETDEKDLISGQQMQDISFIGFDHHYFLQALLPQSRKVFHKVRRAEIHKGVSCRLSHWMSLYQGSVAAGDTMTMAFRSWSGPKTTEQMEAYDPVLRDSLDLGIFSAISGPLMIALKSMHSWLGNWGLAIIVLTILLKLLFYPLTRQAALAQNRMKKLQPRMNEIRELYKEDPRKQQQELMQFMSSHKVNPMKGCLPILPQIPVFIAFYRVLSTSIELRQAPFFLWITDLSAQDPYYITPLLLGLTMFVQQKLMPATGMDKSQERIMMMLPLIFTVMMLTLPAGMVLYMLANTLMSIGQQQWLNRKLALNHG
ncbi:MAG: membrane protein insertase YidC [Deltaproteobacteria bacterium]|nr:membrane protein insertase YidC [Deltaproteobacteria bacterium]